MFTYKTFISLYISLLLAFASSIVFAQNKVSECDSTLTPSQFAVDASKTIEDYLGQRMVFGDKHLEVAAKGLNTVCCDEQNLSDERCSQAEVFEESVPLSTTYFDQMMGVYELMLTGDPSQCEAYDGMSCDPYIFAVYDLPSPAVCFRHGEPVDSRCKSEYNVGSGVDVLGASRDISSAGQYRGLATKFWSDDNRLIVAPARLYKQRGRSLVKETTMQQLAYHVCQEIDIIYRYLVVENSQLSISALQSEGGTYIQKCQERATNLFRQHSEYTKTLAMRKSEDQQEKINTLVRDENWRVFDGILNSISKLVVKMQEAMKTLEQNTGVCSV